MFPGRAGGQRMLSEGRSPQTPLQTVSGPLSPRDGEQPNAWPEETTDAGDNVRVTVVSWEEVD